MGYKEAVEDGIRTEQQRRMIYFIPCEICGKEIKKTQYVRHFNYLCDYCNGVVKKKKKIELNQNTKTKAEERFEKAVCEIKKQVIAFEDYEKSIETAKSRLEKYGSIPEAMVAIELIHLKQKIIPQQKVGKYKVDFAIPDQKIIIEVDGSVFHNGKNDGREATIQLAIGLDWKIIHIPAELIRKDIKKLGTIIDSFR